MKHVDLGEPTSFLDRVHLGCSQRKCKPNESMVDEFRKMFGSRTEKLLVSEKLVQTLLRGCLTWKDKQRNGLNDVANWQKNN